MKLYIALKNISDFEAIDSLLGGNSDISHSFKNNFNPLGINQISNFIESYKILESNKNELFYTNKSLKSTIKGIYFGNDTCEHLLITPTEVKKAISFCSNKKWHIVFRLPPLSEAYITRFKEILELLNDYSCEIVVNDFGALELATHYPSIKKTLGRLFFKTQRNVFLDTFIQKDISPYIFESQMENISHCEYEIQSIREFYKTLDIKRVSLENLKINSEWLKQKPYFNVDIYYPNIFLAKSRACESAGLIEDKAKYHPQSSCTKPCKKFKLEFELSRYTGIFADTNSYYKTKTTLELEKAITKDINSRLIWEIL